MKRFLLFLLVLIPFCLILSCTSFADNTNLYTTVPNEHTIKLVINGNGSISVNGKTYTTSTTLVIPRLNTVQIKIKPASNSFIQCAGYESTLLSSQIYEENFTIPALNCDGILTVYFGKLIVPAVKTGDNTQISLWLLTFFASSTTSIFILKKLRHV